LPKEAPWLDTYVHELISFPNTKHDDQVDSTVFALAWSTAQKGGPWGWLKYMKGMAEKSNLRRVEKPTRVWVAPPVTQWVAIDGRHIMIPQDRIIELTSEEDIRNVILRGGRRVD
jgi:hypothetical protein